MVSEVVTLPSTSDRVDAGTVIAQVSDDFDKQQRYAPYDIGADEVAEAVWLLMGSGFDRELPTGVQK